MSDYSQSTNISNEARRLELISLTANEATRLALKKFFDNKENPSSVIDIGCGTGDALPILAELFPGSSIYAADKSDKALSIAKSRNIAIKTFKSDIMSLSENRELLTQGPFDLVFIRNTLLHIPELDIAISNLMSIVKDKGFLIVQEPDWTYASANWPDFEIFKTSINDAMRLHGINPFVGRSINTVLKKVGFKNIVTEVYESRTYTTDEGWMVIDYLLDVSKDMIEPELKKHGVTSVPDMKERIKTARQDASNYFNNPAWITSVAQK